MEDTNYNLYPSQFFEIILMKNPAQFKHIKIDDKIYKKYKEYYEINFLEKVYNYLINNTVT